MTPKDRLKHAAESLAWTIAAILAGALGYLAGLTLKAWIG